MSVGAVEVEALRSEHWDAVRSIYSEGIATGEATFETEVPTWEAWDRAHLRFGRLIARAEGRIVGWAALSAVSGRPVYSGVAEVSVYVEERSRGAGIGSILLEQLVRESETYGVWTLQAGIFPENVASVQLHMQRGFRRVGLRERLGRLRGRWRDVVLLERRSGVVGTEATKPADEPPDTSCDL